MKYDVTIGIPVYKAEPYIRKTMESALSQTYPSIEFLIVDDAGGISLMNALLPIREGKIFVYYLIPRIRAFLHPAIR